MNLMLRTKDTGQVNIERTLARGFVVLGGLFWALAFFGANTKASYATFVYTLPEVGRASMAALLPLALTISVLVLGVYYERLAGTVLVGGAAAMLGYGFVLHLGEPLLWTTAIGVLVAPAVVGAVLYLLAAHRQEVQEHGHASEPALNR